MTRTVVRKMLLREWQSGKAVQCSIEGRIANTMEMYASDNIGTYNVRPLRGMTTHLPQSLT